MDAEATLQYRKDQLHLLQSDGGPLLYAAKQKGVTVEDLQSQFPEMTKSNPAMILAALQCAQEGNEQEYFQQLYMFSTVLEQVIKGEITLADASYGIGKKLDDDFGVKMGFVQPTDCAATSDGRTTESG